MILSSTFEASRATRSDPRPLTGGQGTVAISNFIGRLGDKAEAGRTAPQPQAFLVEQGPDAHLPPHFHRRNQFQVVVAGGGSIGRHPLAPLSVHYAGGHTGYGPIDSGSEGLWYFTIREIADAGAWFLPEKKDEIDRSIPKRQMTSGAVAPLGADELASRRTTETQSLIAAQADGLEATLHRVAPGATWTASPAGAFYMVTGGTARRDGTLFPRLSVFYASDDEASFGVEAGAEGLEWLELRFPRAAVSDR